MRLKYKILFSPPVLKAILKNLEKEKGSEESTACQYETEEKIPCLLNLGPKNEWKKFY